MATAPSIIAEIPIFFPINISNNNPTITPEIIPIYLPPNSPKKTINITNKLGFIPAIVNQVKKFACNIYIIMNAMHIKNMANFFFFFFLF